MFFSLFYFPSEGYGWFWVFYTLFLGSSVRGVFYFKERLSDFGVLVRGFVILVNLGAVLLGWLICARDFISPLYIEIRVFINERNEVDFDN